MGFNWKKALGGAIGGAAVGGPVGLVAGGALGGFGGIDWVKDKITGPYDKKEQGLTELQGDLAKLKQERLARMDALYGKANAQYDDTRAAMRAAYGDPSTWKL
jgi:hypothetical protein